MIDDGQEHAHIFQDAMNGHPELSSYVHDSIMDADLNSMEKQDHQDQGELTELDLAQAHRNLALSMSEPVETFSSSVQLDPLEELALLQHQLEEEKQRILDDHRQQLAERKRHGKDTRGRPGKSSLYVKFYFTLCLVVDFTAYYRQRMLEQRLKELRGPQSTSILASSATADGARRIVRQPTEPQGEGCPDTEDEVHLRMLSREITLLTDQLLAD